LKARALDSKARVFRPEARAITSKARAFGMKTRAFRSESGADLSSSGDFSIETRDVAAKLLIFLQEGHGMLDAADGASDPLFGRGKKKGHPMARSFYYGTDAELFASSQTFADQISENREALGLSEDAVQRYLDANAAYRAAFSLAIAPQTRTGPSVSAKNAAKKALRIVAAQTAKVISGNREVSDAQRMRLGLVVSTKPSPIGPPTAQPSVQVIRVEARTVKIEIDNTEGGSPRRKPHGVIWARVYTRVGLEMSEDFGQWKHAGDTSHHTMDLVFPSSIGWGTPVWICACWMNRRAQPGPLSNPIMTIVQGGLSMTA
jgi:hypothetical protein